MMKTLRRKATPRRGVLVLGALVLSLSLASVAYATVREVGATSSFTAPSCSDDSCQVWTRSTVFQLKVGNRQNVSKVPRAGSVVAFTLHLPSVIKKYYDYFATTYGGAPAARISILRRSPRKGVTKYRYALVAQSERVKVKDFLGSTPSFALAKPLPVRRGDVIALTTDTWIPSFVVRAEDTTSTWRSSRPKDKCKRVGNDLSNLTTPRMHEQLNQIKQYNCAYVGGRLLYHATVVDTPTKVKGK